MIAALVHGILHRTPESRTSKAGKPFAMATLAVKEGEIRQFIKCFAFGETAQAELMRLKEGEALAVQGALKAEIYRPADGEPRVSLSIFADHVLPIRQSPRTKKAPAKVAESDDARTKQERCAGHGATARTVQTIRCRFERGVAQFGSRARRRRFRQFRALSGART